MLFNTETYTAKLLAACAIVFALESLLFIVLPSDTLGYVLDLFAFTPAYVFSRPWTLVTSVFMHSGFSHFFFNMFALLMFGTALERLIGSRRYIMLYMAAGIIGNLGYMLTQPNALIPSLGASGAIYGVLGCYALLRPHDIVYMNFIPVPMYIAAVLWVGMETVGLFAPSSIAHGAHLFGLVLGFAYGWRLKNEVKQRLTEEALWRHY